MAGKPQELRRWSGKTVEEIRAAYDDEMMERYEKFEPIYRFVTGRMRKPLFSDVDGRVLDVACGAGVNFPHLPDECQVVGIDINDELLELAREKATDIETPVTLHNMDAQALDFEDNAFDTVISSFSTCTFPDPIEALNEMARVCKPDGQIRLLEHGKSDLRPWAWYQERKADEGYEREGCRLYDDPVTVIEQADIDIVYTRTWLFGNITGVIAQPAT